MTIGPDGVSIITTSDDVTAAILAALIGHTAAAANVFSPRDWPVQLPDMPILMLQAPKEHKDSQGPNAPAYNVSCTVRVIGRLTAKATANGNQAGTLLIALGVLQRQIEVAVINNYALYRIISEIVSVDTESQVRSDGNQPIGELTMDFVCNFYQGTEAFAQPVVSPLEQLAVFGDFLNVFDPNGVYEKPFDYPVPEPPRTIGPDGRVEVGAVVVLQQ